MEQICKNCEHFNPDTSVCNWYDLIKLENDWCYGFFLKEEEKKMKFEKEAFDFKILTENEIKEVIKMAQTELNKREQKRRDALITAFVEAWKKLEDDGGSVYICGEHIHLDEDVELY